MESQNCFYCKENLAIDKQDFYPRKIFKITKPSYFKSSKIRYQNIVIFVPRCKSCRRKHNIFGISIITLPSWIAAIVVTSSYIYFEWRPNELIEVIAVSFGLGLAIFILILKVINLFSNGFTVLFLRFIEKEDISNYPLIGKILNLKWYKNFPKKHDLIESNLSMELTDEIKNEVELNHNFKN
jgi:hypothetical protein